MKHPKIYIAGKITNNPNYKEEFNELSDWLKAVLPDVAVLNPATLPKGMSNADYMRICFSMIDTADIVIFNESSFKHQWNRGLNGAQIERDYCSYIRKPYLWFSENEALTHSRTCPECHSPLSLFEMIAPAEPTLFKLEGNKGCPLCGKLNLFHSDKKQLLRKWNLLSTLYDERITDNVDG